MSVDRVTAAACWAGLGYVPDRIARNQSGSVVASGSSNNVKLEVDPAILSTEIAGFGFFAGGSMSASELLGVVTWGDTLTFSGSARDIAITQYAPTSPSIITLWNRKESGSFAQVGTITFSGMTGAISWGSGYTHAPGDALEIYAPVTPDPTLANVRVQAYVS